MPNSKYDVLVVGAGPAGIFACYELLNKKKKLKIGLIDMGHRIEKRKPSEVMSGFGGAGTFSDGKLHFTATLSHEKAFHLIDSKDYQDILEYVDTVFTKFGVDAEYFPKETEDLEKLKDEAMVNDIELVVRKARHVGTDKLKEVMSKFEKYLLEKGVEILEDTEVVDILVKDNSVKGVVTKDGKKIYCDTVLLAPGRIRASWLQKLATKLNIPYIYDKVEVGVRVEFPNSIMRRQAEALYEMVYRVRTKTYHDIVRTFCSCPNGLVAKEEYEGYICVNGHSNSDHLSKNSNFALLCEVNLTEPVENSIAYAKSIAEVASTIGGGKPILQSLEDLNSGRRSTWSRLKKSFVSPSLVDVTPGDIAMALPYRIVKNIQEGLEILDTVMPGIHSGSTLLYAPEVKFRSSKISTDEGLQTCIKGLYVAGDGAGLSGAITGAAVTGIMFARGLN
ncbi:MAG TPA: FAD-dependent oxidoreductase [Candidatus Dojkabacteria bacterium]|nr:FAD-dependent oxidoreductase [Candidatus Dojkabacteria bacterium]